MAYCVPVFHYWLHNEYVGVQMQHFYSSFSQLNFTIGTVADTLLVSVRTVLRITKCFRLFQDVWHPNHYSRKTRKMLLTATYLQQVPSFAHYFMTNSSNFALVQLLFESPCIYLDELQEQMFIAFGLVITIPTLCRSIRFGLGLTRKKI
jgi:hypothetical protein